MKPHSQKTKPQETKPHSQKTHPDLPPPSPLQLPGTRQNESDSRRHYSSQPAPHPLQAQLHQHLTLQIQILRLAVRREVHIQQVVDVYNRHSPRSLPSSPVPRTEASISSTATTASYVASPPLSHHRHHAVPHHQTRVRLAQTNQRLQQSHRRGRPARVVASHVLVVASEDELRRRGEKGIEVALDEENVTLQLVDRPQRRWREATRQKYSDNERST